MDMYYKIKIESINKIIYKIININDWDYICKK